VEATSKQWDDAFAEKDAEIEQHKLRIKELEDKI
jgi:hypothetical protein